MARNEQALRSRPMTRLEERRNARRRNKSFLTKRRASYEDKDGRWHDEVSAEKVCLGANFSDKFWFCANSDSATATFASVNSTGGLTPNVLGTTTSANVLQASGSGALISHLSCTGSACNGGSSTYANGFPASLAGTTWTEQTVIRMPMMAIQFSAVP